mmetsp:Transcript_6267/g.11847  ORF Transcript_6267/g.11847 Transcript_6267/m.11847 type:complete len:124 (-) Transcript_6267:252-623(-)
MWKTFEDSNEAVPREAAVENLVMKKVRVIANIVLIVLTLMHCINNKPKAWMPPEALATVAVVEVIIMEGEMAVVSVEIKTKGKFIQQLLKQESRQRDVVPKLEDDDYPCLQNAHFACICTVLN